MGPPRACSTVVGRFEGPQAREVSILCRPTDGKGDADSQSLAAYQELAAVLGAEHASFRDLTWETVFVRDVRRDAPSILAARERVLGDLGERAEAPVPAIIGQAPIDAAVSCEVLATAVVPRDGGARSVRAVALTPTCRCEACARSGGRLVELGEERALYTGNVYGTGSDPFDEALDMFGQAERLLGACKMSFRDVMRTWIYVRDIDRDYGALNDARREFFRRSSVELRPASTGVQGTPVSDVHDFSLRLHALTSTGPVDVTPISCPSLNEAWSYGADFSRGLRVLEGNRMTLHVSGTASIDDQGRSVHTGDLTAQVGRMLDNIASLLAQHGATYGQILSGVLYVKRQDDAGTVHSLCRARNFDGFPCALVEAPLCRPELLCEAEVVAALPLRPREA